MDRWPLIYLYKAWTTKSHGYTAIGTNRMPYGGRRHSHTWSNTENYNLLQQAATEVAAISSKCQTNYSLARLIVHKVIKGRASSLSETPQNTTMYNKAQLRDGSNVELCAFHVSRGCLKNNVKKKKNVIVRRYLKTYICTMYFFSLVFFILQTSKRGK